MALLDLEVTEKKKKVDPTKCEHFTVRRIMDAWYCLECGAEFIPKDKKHVTAWNGPPKIFKAPQNY